MYVYRIYDGETRKESKNEANAMAAWGGRYVICNIRSVSGRRGVGYDRKRKTPKKYIYIEKLFCTIEVCYVFLNSLNNILLGIETYSAPSVAPITHKYTAEKYAKSLVDRLLV